MSEYFEEIQQCGCKEGTIVAVKDIETEVYLCFTCGYAGVTPANMDFKPEIHISDLKPALRTLKRMCRLIVEIKDDIDDYIAGGWDGNMEGWQCMSDKIANHGVVKWWDEISLKNGLPHEALAEDMRREMYE